MTKTQKLMAGLFLTMSALTLTISAEEAFALSKPSAPTYSVVQPTALRVNVNAQAYPSGTTFEILRHNDGKTFSISGTDTLFEINLIPNTLYQYSVRVLDSTGTYSEYSDVSSIYTLADIPSKNTFSASTKGQVSFSWLPNQNHMGTTYEYEVRKTDGTVVKKGSTKQLSVTINDMTPLNINYEVFVRGLNDGNVPSGWIKLDSFFHDSISPTLTFFQSVNSWTNGDISINVETTDSGSGVEKIILPNGNEVRALTANYAVSQNGTYTFRSIDKQGNVKDASVVVSLIDKTLPKASHNIEYVSDNKYLITILAEDSLSGVKEITLPNGDKVIGTTAEYYATKGQVIDVNIMDNALNKMKYSIIATVPELTITPKENHTKVNWTVGMVNVAKMQLFRDSQLIYEGLSNSFDDVGAIDKANPNPIMTADFYLENSKINVLYAKPEDNGTSYRYKLEAYNQSNNKVTSAPVETILKSEVVGYSYILDKSAYTEPDNSIDTISEKIPMNIVSNERFYLHIRAIDKEGNASAVYHTSFQDAKAPLMELSVNDTEWTASPVLISVNATDEYGIKRIKIPNGSWVNASNTTYAVTENGTYTFVSEDLAGNQTTKSITISKVDRTPPTPPTVTAFSDWTKNVPVTITVTSGTDSLSGVARVEFKLEGATTESWKTYSAPIGVSKEGITRVVTRTVDKMGNVSEEKIAQVKIDLSAPHNAQIIIELLP